ncbi:predicted protein [Botrytis cinerea T4]|uniref:Uncharacterized protein n=1 Tax=Botryotinia fuckeliana (strain T4) TaxID=999810 RepID=G2YX30_BOTF4|nr:predicted protein [Botrytis cinerea T4]
MQWNEWNIEKHPREPGSSQLPDSSAVSPHKLNKRSLKSVLSEPGSLHAAAPSSQTSWTPMRGYSGVPYSVPCYSNAL